MKLFYAFAGLVQGHGRILEPPGRSSYHLLTNDAEIDQSLVVPNYNDNQLFCGGLHTQIANEYKCGVCGDDYRDARPRANELGGRYGSTGLIPRTYEQGDLFDVKVQLTAHHKGFFEFKLCEMKPGMTTEDESCFDMESSIIELENGGTKWDVTEKHPTTYYESTLRLPDSLSCEHCVLQWRYHTGNSWGCDDSGCGLGLGHQEEFYGCADIKINPRDGARPSTSPVTKTTNPATKTTTTKAATKTTTTKATTKSTISVTTKTVAPTADVDDIDHFCTGQGNGMYPHPHDCQKFIQCSNGATFVRTCSNGLLFDPAINNCNWPNNVQC